MPAISLKVKTVFCGKTAEAIRYIHLSQEEMKNVEAIVEDYAYRIAGINCTWKFKEIK